MYLSFQLDRTRRWAMDLGKVRHVEAYRDVFALPRQKPAVLGLYRFQDFLVPVFNFRSLLGDLVDDDGLPLPHLVIFYGRETLNAFPALVEESIQEDCVLLENSMNVSYLDAYDLIYNDLRYHQLNFRAIEEHLNIP